jgi:hypothetical protein
MDADGWSALGAHGLTFEFATRRALLANRRRRSRWCPPRRQPIDDRPSRAAGTTSPTWKPTDKNSSGIQLSSKDRRTIRSSLLDVGRSSRLAIQCSLGPPLRKQDLEGVLIFLSCGGGMYLLDYLLTTLITRFLSPSRANFLLYSFLTLVGD